MECPRHKDREVIGYCTICGEFGCTECLTEYSSRLYCPKDFKPIAERMKQRAAQAEAGQERPKLVARTLAGDVLRGYCLHLNPEERGFHLEEVSERGKALGPTRYVLFSDLKAVFVVRSFDEKGETGDGPSVYWRPSGEDLVVRFRDGEVLRGRAYQSGRIGPPRFVMIPEDSESNNLAVLVECAATEGVYTPQEYRSRLIEDLRTYLLNHSHAGLSKEEVSGDFFFARHEYEEALDHYRSVAHLAPRSHRIRKKLIAAEYNVAANYARRHEYEQAYACLTRILDLDPHHEKAREKARILHHALKKANAGGRA